MDKMIMIEFSQKRESRVYSLHFPYGAPSGELREVLQEIVNEIESICKKAEEASNASDHARAENTEKEE